jgi:exosortase
LIEDFALTAAPSAEVVRQRAWQASLVVVVAALAFAFSGALRELIVLWTTKADYSHGLLIVPFCAYLLATRREFFPVTIAWPDWRGLPFLALAAVVYVAADKVNLAREWLQASAVMLAFVGVVVMFCGRWQGLLWAWPVLVFLPLAFPLPFRVENAVSLKLRSFATRWGNYGFQTIGLPSYQEGNVIVLPHAEGETRLGVEQACSGLSMLLAFVALSAAIAFLYKSRPWVDRAIIFFSAFPIALICNMLRIVVTGLVYYAGWTQLGDLIVHDLAGWLMMPLALGILWLELRLMDWVTEPVETVTADVALGLRQPGAAGRVSSRREGPFNPMHAVAATGAGAGPNPLKPTPPPPDGAGP